MPIRSCLRFAAVDSSRPVSRPILFYGNVPDYDEENDMTELRRQMNDAMILRGFALRTRET